MEIVEIRDFMRKYILSIIVGGLLCTLVGLVVYYFYPSRYQAVGYIYVVRQLNSLPDGDTSPAEFTYEGFYAQQNAQHFTPTVIGILESDTLKRSVLERQDIVVTSQNLRLFSRLLGIKKKTPQLIEVTIKTASAEKSTRLWKDTLDSLIETVKPITSAGDSQLVIAPLSESPVVRQTYKSLPLNIVVGFVLGALLSIFLCALKETMGFEMRNFKRER